MLNEELVINIYARGAREQVRDKVSDCNFVMVEGPWRLDSLDSLDDTCQRPSTPDGHPSVVCLLEEDCGDGYQCVQRSLKVPEIVYGFLGIVISAFSTCILN